MTSKFGMYNRCLYISFQVYIHTDNNYNSVLEVVGHNEGNEDHKKRQKQVVTRNKITKANRVQEEESECKRL